MIKNDEKYGEKEEMNASKTYENNFVFIFETTL